MISAAESRTIKLAATTQAFTPDDVVDETLAAAKVGKDDVGPPIVMIGF